MGPAAAQGKHASPELAVPLRYVSPQATGQHQNAGLPIHTKELYPQRNCVSWPAH